MTVRRLAHTPLHLEQSHLFLSSLFIVPLLRVGVEFLSVDFETRFKVALHLPEDLVDVSVGLYTTLAEHCALSTVSLASALPPLLCNKWGYSGSHVLRVRLCGERWSTIVYLVCQLYELLCLVEPATPSCGLHPLSCLFLAWLGGWKKLWFAPFVKGCSALNLQASQRDFIAIVVFLYCWDFCFEWFFDAGVRKRSWWSSLNLERGAHRFLSDEGVRVKFWESLRRVCLPYYSLASLKHLLIK